MNKDNAHEFIPLVQALADGETIQMLNSDGSRLIDMVNLTFHGSPKEYHIKPKQPRVVGHYPIGVPAFSAIELTDEVKEALEKAGISYGD